MQLLRLVPNPYLTYDLSVIIPARNEEWLSRTVESVFTAARAKTECVVVLDGSWASPPLEQREHLTIIHHNVSIGQRAAINEAVRLSKSKYVMKLDAHCSLGEGFDEKLISVHRPDWVQVPLLFNFRVFHWRCLRCNNQTDQGPQPTRCTACRKGTQFDRVIIWKPKDGTWWQCGQCWEVQQSTEKKPNCAKCNVPLRSLGRRMTDYMRFDHDLIFKYGGKPKWVQEQTGNINDTMSLLGACYFMEREHYLKLGYDDQKYGSWGSQGIEVACKTWLSGGRLVINKSTWYSHLFRTQPGFGFPYPNAGPERSRARAREIWYANKWPKQIYPLAWLVEKFAPVPGWHDSVGAARLAEITKAAIAFSRVGRSANLTDSTSLGGVAGWQQMSTDAVSPSSLLSTGADTAKQVDLVGGQSQVERTEATSVIADVVKDESILIASRRKWANQPSPNDSVKSALGAVVSDSPVAHIVNVPCPNPTASLFIEAGSGKDSNDLDCRKMRDREILVGSHDSVSDTELGLGSGASQHVSDSPIIASRQNAGVVYYTDSQLREPLATACRNQLQSATNSHKIVSVSLQPLDFATNITLSLKRGYLAMFQQILAGLSELDTDYVFLCEHDCLYPPEHFEFTPERNDIFYYNQNCWKINIETGHALFYYANQVSGLCADRQLLIDHYRRRIERVEREGFNRRQGFEPGTRSTRHGGIDDYGWAKWMSRVPYLDVRHGKNLTPSRWSKSQFRNQKYTAGWTESDSVPGWGKTEGVFSEFLQRLSSTLP